MMKREKIILSFHSYLNSPFTGLSRLVRGLLSEVSLATVNSTGSRDNLSLVMPKEKIRIVEHVPDGLFFNKLDREVVREKYHAEEKLVILYVGRLDSDKRCDRLIKVCDCLHDSDDVLFVFVGEGVLSNLIEQLQKKRSNILYLGYVSKREKMHELYTLADLTWSFADETYLALPALESLASGTPILIPELAAVRFKDEAGAKVNSELVPSDIGWIIPDTEAGAVADWLRKLDKDALREKRANCRAYATKRYFHAGLSPEVVDDVARLFK
jgi:glycosyltransferase involved in cell wall biosynthesis